MLLTLTMRALSRSRGFMASHMLAVPYRLVSSVVWASPALKLFPLKATPAQSKAKSCQVVSPNFAAMSNIDDGDTALQAEKHLDV